MTRYIKKNIKFINVRILVLGNENQVKQQLLLLQAIQSGSNNRFLSPSSIVKVFFWGKVPHLH